MKNLIRCLLFALPVLLKVASAQNIAINTDGSIPDASAMLDITSTTKGFLAPRMTTAQQNAISSPATGLLVFNTTDNTFKVNTGTPGTPVWTTLSASSNNWLLSGNSGTNGTTNFIGTTDNTKMNFRTNNLQRMVIDASGRVGIGVTTPGNPLVVKDTLEISRTGSAVSQLLFSNTAGAGDFRIGGDGGDIFWQGGGGRNLQMGAYWGVTLAGDRQTATFPSFAAGVANTGVLVQAQRDASVPLAIQSNSASQTANLTEWRNSSGTILNTVNKNGNVAIGASSFNTTNPEKLLVDAGTTSSVNAIVGKGSINNYLQLNIQNNSSGTNASSDVVATANNGDETTNYVDMGINGGSNTAGIMGGANDGYLYTMGNNFLIGTGNASKSLVFMTGGTSQSTNERMRIDGSGNVGIGNTSPSQKLDITGNLKFSGALMPNNTAGTSGYLLQSGGAGAAPTWVDPATLASTGWALNGNSVTSMKSIGTTSNYDLPFITNNTEKMRIETSGEVGIGTSSFNATNPEKLLVNAGTTTSVNAIVGKGSIDSYLQLNIQNNSSGTSASSDVVATANNGNETSNYVDMGINGGSYTGGVMGAANDGYLYTMGNNFLLGTGNASKSLIFMTGGTSQSTNERMRIDGSGNVGIGNTSPSQKLDITGNLKFSGALMPNNTAGTSGYLLQSNGSGAAPTWVDAASTNWIQNGNSVTSIKSVGTTSNYDLPFITNNSEKMRIATTGDVAIGATSFNATNPEQFLVNAGTTTSVNAIVGKGSINNYLQLNIQNTSSGTNASSDVVATANNGDESTNFVDMGINGGSNTSNVMGGANDSYLYNQGQNFLIGTGTAAKSLIFMTGGTTQSSNERMRIDGSGNVGVGTNNPNSTLSITGSMSVSYRSGSGAYTVLSTDNVIINTGGSTPTWTLPAASSCSGRVYRLINHGTTSVTLSQAVTTASGVTSTTLLNSAGSNNYEIISDGTVWRKIN